MNFKAVIFILTLIPGGFTWAESCPEILSTTPLAGWTEHLRDTVSRKDRFGNELRFHYEKEFDKFLNVSCEGVNLCGDGLVAELLKLEPGIQISPDLRTTIETAMKLSRKWEAALSFSWIEDKSGLWTFRLSLDIAPVGKNILQSEGIELQSDTRVNRIDITIEPTRTTVAFATVAAVTYGSDLITAETASHSGAVVLGSQNNPQAIDAIGLRREFFVGPTASAGLNLALEAATNLTLALHPANSSLTLDSRKGRLAEFTQGRWQWKE